MKNLLVTGGAGFIGTNFCLFAKAKKFNVVALDNLSKDASKQNRVLLSKAGIRFVHVDVKKPLVKKMGHVDVIVHLASHCSTPRSIEKPYEDFLDNALGTLNVLEYARKNNKIPVIYASTIKVYPDSVINSFPLKESDTRYRFAKQTSINENCPIEKGSHAPYGCSKYVGDLYCQEYFHTYQVPTVINRMSTVFGPYQYGTEEAGWIYHFVKSKKLGLPITVYGTGKQVRDPLWVGDLCHLMLKQIQRLDKIKGRVYNVGGGQGNAISLLELIDYLNRKQGPKMKVNFQDFRPSDLRVYISDLTKVKNDLNWTPLVNVKQGVDRLFEQI